MDSDIPLPLDGSVHRVRTASFQANPMSQHFIDSSHTLRDIVQSKLARSPPVSGRNLRADVVQGEVVLTGAVATYYQKQMAQESVRTIDGVTSVRNELEVMSH